jgi:hypothetical protein
MLRLRTLAALAGLGCAVLLAGCGGSSSSGSSSSSSTTDTAASNEGRLSDAAWMTYTQVRARARQVNAAATKTFRTCSQLQLSQLPPEKIQACLGDSTSTVVEEGQKLLGVLDGFESEAAGECATALHNLQGTARLYVASVNTLGNTAQSRPTGVAPQLDTAQQALTHARAAQVAFEAACSPNA